MIYHKCRFMPDVQKKLQQADNYLYPNRCFHRNRYKPITIRTDNWAFPHKRRITLD